MLRVFPAVLLWMLTISTTAHAGVIFDWATVGNAGNNSDSVSAFGRVTYEYRIAKTEVTNAQYAEFLNAVAATDTYNLYNPLTANDARGGILRSGSPGSYSYSTKTNMANKPVIYVSWYDATRFANWMTNGQGAGGTESGVYTLTGPTSISGITRDLNNPNQIFLPTEDEWYKAAYHQPATQGGDYDDYWYYQTGSNAAPDTATADNTGNITNPGAEVANHSAGAYWNNTFGNLTTVGSAGPLAESYYGTSDQGGNVREWNEAIVSSGRGLRGGSWRDSPGWMWSLFRFSDTPEFESDRIGFRVASSIPEPTSIALIMLGAPLLLRRRRN